GTGITFAPPSTGAETAIITATSTRDSTKSGSASVAVTVSAGVSACAGMTLGDEGSLNGFVPFPASSAWNTDISSAPLDPNNSTITSASGFAGLHLHHDWSSVAGGDYGIPFTVVDTSTQPVVPITVNAYANESDVSEPHSRPPPLSRGRRQIALTMRVTSTFWYWIETHACCMKRGIRFDAMGPLAPIQKRFGT